MKRNYLIITMLFIFIQGGSVCAQDLDFYFPKEIKQLNPEIPTPKDFLGFDVGQQYITYDQTVAYLRLLAQKSDRIKFVENGFTYERKPLVFLTISSKENLSNIDKIRQTHLDLCNPEKSGKIYVEHIPIVTWMGYSVHGNEASGINASVIVAYILAASNDVFIQNVLQNNIIILQPALNPDGSQRYATWVNSNKSQSENSDENNREFREPAPSSRSNHYWFDLNRDWLFVQNPESYYRMEQFYKWMPTFVNDYHEHGNTSGTYFSPGIKNSTNSLIPEENWIITKKISDYHAKILSSIGTMYFSKEGYDDFYTGKGATLPDLTGGIGVLYEQPNPRGFVREKDGIKFRFTDMIKNQVYCSMSALMAALEMKNELLTYQKNFFIEKKREAEKDLVKGYVFGSKSDISLSKEFMRILKTHDIDVYKLNKNITVGQKTFDKDFSYIVPCNQNKYPVIKTIFEKTTSYKDSSFYDVTTWTIPLGFNIDYSDLKEISGLTGEKADIITYVEIAKVPVTNYAYLFEISDYYSYKFLYYLQSKGIMLKAGDSPFAFIQDGHEHQFKAGVIMISVKEQAYSIEEINKILNEYSAGPKISILAVNNGTGEKFDLGSGHFKIITKPTIAILTGKGATYSIIGEIWHLLDLRFGIPVTLLDADIIGGDIDLNKYNTIIIANSFKLTKEASDKLTTWASNNTLIAIGAAYKTANDIGISDINTIKDKNQKDSTVYGKYSDFIEKNNSSSINGVILNSKIDLSHPLAYGLSNGEIPLFKEGEIFLSKPTNKYITPVCYSDNPLLSGYMGKKYPDMIKGTPAVLAGKSLIYFVDDPYFRACWLGSSRLLMNALFFRELVAKEKVQTEK